MKYKNQLLARLHSLRSEMAEIMDILKQSDSRIGDVWIEDDTVYILDATGWNYFTESETGRIVGLPDFEKPCGGFVFNIFEEANK